MAAAIFTALIVIGLLIARYRHERILIHDLEKAIVMYRLHCGAYPAAGDLASSLDSVAEIQFYLKSWQSRIDSQGRFADHWGSPVVYLYPGVHNPGLFDIYSRGMNRKDDLGKGDDIKNWHD